ncbi:hypothetical protein GLOTRDRAFT_138894 [Gloeophyllum trabeum ATCC 11539]|uniref:Acid protease n=1 Tax=Gloeophyllum trabeum (strain ATCC 11539 / FP-39264 / Madison 617) TaxID=670483 RepID=S7Q703_GLOTA|nr:uncharacterized protein GLOTRDRAFT_138894 [Gloeophyllum trabeum ATCC 11539]EPQ55302.1 hypothetical protein GLOTRDRAFT_138894 [Gloeophyllum trabeum ATCC 11539]
MLYAKTFVAALLAAAALVQAEPTPTSSQSINPQGIALKPVEKRAPSPSVDLSLSNAQRLARGLPPRKPKRRERKINPRLAARAAASPCPSTTHSGVIQVTNAGTGAAMGYLPRTYNVFGEYGVTTDPSAALHLSFGTSSCGGSPAPTSGSQLDILTTNGPSSTFPYLVLISGSASTDADFRPGSTNYAYVGGGTQTPPGSPAVTAPNSFSATTGIPEGVQSAVWVYDAASGAISAQWVNTDRSACLLLILFPSLPFHPIPSLPYTRTPATRLLYAPSDNVIIAAGDVRAFASAFGQGTEVTLKFVPEATVVVY